MIEKSDTRAVNVLVGSVEATHIPRIGNVGIATREAHHLIYLSCCTLAEHTVHIAYIRTIHSDKHIVFIGIDTCKLNGALSVCGYAVLCKLRASGRIYGISYLLGACGRGCDHELVRKSRLGNELLKNKLRHRRAAYIAVTNEHDSFHRIILYSIFHLAESEHIINA